MVLSIKIKITKIIKKTSAKALKDIQEGDILKINLYLLNTAHYKGYYNGNYISGVEVYNCTQNIGCEMSKNVFVNLFDKIFEWKEIIEEEKI